MIEILVLVAIGLLGIVVSVLIWRIRSRAASGGGSAPAQEPEVGFAQRHIQGLFLIQAAVCISFALAAWIAHFRMWWLLTVGGLMSAAIFVAMFWLRRPSEKLLGGN